MTPALLADQVRAAIATLAPLGRPGGGISLHHPPAAAIEAALATPGARFMRYTRSAAPQSGYIRLVVDGVEVAFHEVPVALATAAGFVVPCRGGERRRR